MTKTTGVRIGSSLIAVLTIILIIKFGGYIGIAVTCFFISLVALSEFGHMTLQGERYRIARKSFIAMGLIAFTISIYRNDWLLHSFVLSTLAIFVTFLMLARDDNAPLEELVNKSGLCLLGILYAGVCPVYIALLARLSDHLEWFIFALTVVFSGDTTAYFVGRKFGRVKLFTRISPSKSIEGAIGSLFASVIAGLLVATVFLTRHRYVFDARPKYFDISRRATGDLCESMIKRSFHTKDSGKLMPGHGGILDRLDGILFGAPLVYIYAKYVVLP